MTDSQYSTIEIQTLTEVRQYEYFKGAVYTQMQRLLTGRDPKTGRRIDVPRFPIHPKELMELRLGRTGSKGDKEDARNEFILTNAAVIPNPDGEDVKFVIGHPLIYKLKLETKLNKYGCLPINSQQYKRFYGFKLTASQARTLQSDIYALPKVRREFLQFLAEYDTKLADLYIRSVERSARGKFEKDVLGLSPPLYKGFHLLGFDSVGVVLDFDPQYDDVMTGSDIDGLDHLDSEDTTIIGVATDPELVAQKMRISLYKLLKYLLKIL